MKKSYDGGARLLTSLNVTEDGPFASDTVTNTYWNRLRVNMDLQQPTGVWTNAFDYDLVRRLYSVVSPAGEFDYQYQDSLPSTLIKKLVFGNTSYITNIYDGNARMLGTWLKKSDNTTLDFATYAYNIGNQRIGYTNSLVGTHGYSYDRIGQVIAQTGSRQYNYGYDAAWNMTSLTNALGADSFSVDGKNQLYEEWTHATTYYYDADGDLTDGFTSGYLYDAEHRLVSVASGDGGTFEYPPNPGDVRTDFAYDGLGRLRKQVYYSAVECDEFEGYCWQVTGETHYIYDGMRVIQERDINNVPAVSYTRGTDLSGSMEGAGGIGGLLARSHAFQSGSGAFTNHNYYFADGNGNISYLETAGQGLGALYSYDPFGNQEYALGRLAAANKYRFSSKEIVMENSYDFPLYYYGYRFYAPYLQRWLNRDPVSDLSFIILTHRVTMYGGIAPNNYTFIDNKAVGSIDPLGLTIYYCSVPTSSFPTLGIGRHAYLWDDRPGLTDAQRECGQESSCGSGGHTSGNTGPGGSQPQASGTICIAVSGSDGHEAGIMADCAAHANTGIWFPGINDCHNKVQRCLVRNGLTPPSNPRFRPGSGSSPGWNTDPTTGIPYGL